MSNALFIKHQSVSRLVHRERNRIKILSWLNKTESIFTYLKPNKRFTDDQYQLTMFIQCRLSILSSEWFFSPSYSVDSGAVCCFYCCNFLYMKSDRDRDHTPFTYPIFHISHVYRLAIEEFAISLIQTYYLLLCKHVILNNSSLPLGHKKRQT